VIKRHGKGTYSEGSNKYEGDWKEDKMSGVGKFTYASGAVYLSNISAIFNRFSVG
jgi:hypothetical protein